MGDFDAETALTVGDWDPRYARVLDVQVDGDVAAALVDANGDGADVSVGLYTRQPTGDWGCVISGGDGARIPGWCAEVDGNRVGLRRTPVDPV